MSILHIELCVCTSGPRVVLDESLGDPAVRRVVYTIVKSVE